jgi:protein-S-isoprenylcysteine O-methyltransferase Ste14
MKGIIAFYMRFTGKEFSIVHKILSMVPGFFIFLILSPFVIFQVSSFLRSFISLSCPRSVELVIMSVSLLISMIFMSWALFELWTRGKGTPAPITPTHNLVITGPYRWCRNPIELGTNMYILALGIYFDSLVTGVLCMFFGLVLGTAYIKLIEEKEMVMRFGEPYNEYLHSVPFMSFLPLFLLKAEKKYQ